MPKILKFSLFVFVVAIVSLISVNQAQAAAKIRFTDNVQLDFTNVPATVYIASSSECDSLTVSTSTLNADVPAGSTFTLKTANYTVLGLTPSGGTTTLAFDTSYFSAGYKCLGPAHTSLFLYILNLDAFGNCFLQFFVRIVYP